MSKPSVVDIDMKAHHADMQTPFRPWQTEYHTSAEESFVHQGFGRARGLKIRPIAKKLIEARSWMHVE